MADLDKEIADSLESPAELLPHLPFLLQDIPELGGMSDHLLASLGTLPFSAPARALDLGCGKGIIACRMARELGWEVLGVDWFAPFLDEARLLADQQGLTRLCRFEHADARTVVERESGWDVLVLFSVGRIFGTIRDTVGKLRQAVRPGGYLAIEEMFQRPGHADPLPAYAHGTCADHASLLCELTSHGDQLVDERLYDVNEMAHWNTDATLKIENRARELAVRHPELEGLLSEYVGYQRLASDTLETRITCGLWMLKRS